MSYDERCDELARVFLESEPADVNTEENVARIAQAIQDTIEGELADLQDKDEQEA